MNFEINVENIKCHGCAHSIQHGLQKLKGIEAVEVDVEKGLVRVRTSGDTLRQMIVKKLKQMGYPEPGKGSGLTKATSYVSCMIGRVTS